MTETVAPLLRLTGRHNDGSSPPRASSRGLRAGAADPFLGPEALRIKAAFDLPVSAREATTLGAVEFSPAADDIVALETRDGTAIFMRFDRLCEEAARLMPEAVGADGALIIDKLRPAGPEGRGLGDWLWAHLSLIELQPDDIARAAERKIVDWLREKGCETFVGRATAAATRLGVKALMAAIEDRLPRGPGLYRWGDGGHESLTPIAASDFGALGDKPLLLFIHGIASSTGGSFGDLGRTGTWSELSRHYGPHIYAFEHPTFSESPIDNALKLAEALPDGARLHIVTHSRGGLVGDLLCLGPIGAELIDAWRPSAAANDDAAELAALAAEEKAKLRRLRDLLERRNFRIDRYVRVASPARGTRLAGENLDLFLSGLLNLIGRVPALQGNLLYSAVKRIVLEIAHKRADPAWIPGVEALMPNSALAGLLARAPRKQGVRMAVIAGDISGGALWQRLAVMFTDWMFFDQVDNDLVVDTESMFAGLARGEGTRYLYQQGPDICHFSYFENQLSREALKDWLTSEKPDALAVFQPVGIENGQARDAVRALPRTGGRPVVFVLPGVMGSHLAAGHGPDGALDRIWLEVGKLRGGGFAKLGWAGEADRVQPDGVLERYYGECCRHLAETHDVEVFAFDWRAPIEQEAARLAEALRNALAGTEQPVRLLAHSMGGLVARAMIALHGDVWNDIVARPGGRLVMLGTPNNGSHTLVEALLGKRENVRGLAMLDAEHDLQAIVDIVGGMPGALQLMPRPGFIDTGERHAKDYFSAPTWERLRKSVKDRWFGDGVAWRGDEAALAAARGLWDRILRDNAAPRPWDRVAYVFGMDDNTPCGVDDASGTLRMVGTPMGDGTVTWKSSRFGDLPDDRYWYMPASHGKLLDTRQHFDAIADLLSAGATERLHRVPPVARSVGAPETVVYDAGPAPIPSFEEVADSAVGARVKRKPRRTDVSTIEVCVCAQDLRFARSPVVCGHYIGDPIAGAEDQLDRHVVAGALRQREQLRLYAGAVGTSTLAMQVGDGTDRRCDTRRGALVLGLGSYGELTARDLAETVRAGALHYLVHYQGLGAARQPSGSAPAELALSPLLIGFNSTSHLGIDDSIEAVIAGIAEANHQFASATGLPLRIGRIEFTELFLDNAISAARLLEPVCRRLARRLDRLRVRLKAGTELRMGEGARPRLQSAAAEDGHWSRLMVTDADAAEIDCPPECFEVRTVSAMPRDKCRELLRDELKTGDAPARRPDAPAPKLAERLKFVYLSTRARAERVVQQRQPGLIESLVAKSIGNDRFIADHCRSLYELMVPVDFKSVTANTDRLLLVVDGYTANLPWEMLVDGAEPLVVKTSLVRQLASGRYRTGIRTALTKSAYVVGNPSTEGYVSKFEGRSGVAAAQDCLASLPEAETEAHSVAEILRRFNYGTETAIGGDTVALDVIGRLFRRHYRIIHIAAHGVFNALDGDGRPRSGVVLSDGLMLTAAEIGQIEVLPELVFLNCCHLGVADNLPRNGNRVAYSLARELIETGVRCVIAAGWSVNDAAAKLFAESFYQAMLGDALPFGEAVFRARRMVYEQMPESNTWGAYQAYGDPMFRFDPSAGHDDYGDGWKPVAPMELVDFIERQTIDATAASKGAAGAPTAPGRLVANVRRKLASVPAGWLERPDVQYALGALYAGLGPDYADEAIAAYRMAAETGDDRVSAPIGALERVADLQVRLGLHAGRNAGMDTAIKQLKSLLVGPAAGSADKPVANARRWALLGGALKRRAAAELGKKSPNAEHARKWLQESRDAYAMGEGGRDDMPLDPRCTISRIQIQHLLGELTKGTAKGKALEAAAAAREKAVKLFQEDGGFFNAIMPIDADVAIALIEGKLSDPGLTGQLAADYREAALKVPGGQRRLASVANGLKLMANLCRTGKQNASAAALEAIAAALPT